MGDSTNSIQDGWETFAMQSEQVSQDRKWFDADDVGAAIGMSATESSKLAAVLIDAEWLMPHPTPICGKLIVRMTKTGFDEVAKFRQPRPVRWLSKNAAIITLAVAMLALLVSVAAFLQRFF